MLHPGTSPRPSSRESSVRVSLVVGLLLPLAAGCHLHAQPVGTLGISPSGHYITYNGRTLLLDDDVDGADLDVFRACMSGSSIPADPQCAG